MDFPAFDHAAFLARAWHDGPPRHNLGASGFVAENPLAGLPGQIEASDVAGLELHAATAYRDAVARHLRLKPEQVRGTAGTTGANLAVLACLVRPGATVVCERPYYAPMPHVAAGFGARLRFVERDDAGHLDPHEVDAAMDADTALVLLTSPNNPMGVPMAADALRHLGESAQRIGAHVLVDQVFADLADHAWAAPLHERLVSTGGFNKCWGAPGLRAGWVAGAPDVLERVEEAHRLLVMAPPPAGLRLATALLGQADARRRLLAQRLRANHTVFRAWLEAHGRVAPHGDLFAFLPVPGDSQKLAETLLAGGILTVPGEGFGRGGHLRIGLGIPTAALEAALEALDHGLATWAGTAA